MTALVIAHEIVGGGDTPPETDPSSDPGNGCGGGMRVWSDHENESGSGLGGGMSGLESGFGSVSAGSLASGSAGGRYDHGLCPRNGLGSDRDRGMSGSGSGMLGGENGGGREKSGGMNGLGSGIGVLSLGGGCDLGSGIEGGHGRGGEVSGLSGGGCEKRDDCLKGERGGMVELSVELELALVWYR